MAELICRQARLDDSADIHALLLGAAADIPLLVDTLEREEALYAAIRNCARSGESWVACDPSGRIVAAVLAERSQYGRHYAEHEAIELRWAAMRAGAGDEAVLEALIQRVQQRMVPVAATVSPQNRTGLDTCLERLGFAAAPSAGGERRWRWEPGRQASASG